MTIAIPGHWLTTGYGEQLRLNELEGRPAGGTLRQRDQPPAGRHTTHEARRAQPDKTASIHSHREPRIWCSSPPQRVAGP